MGINWILYNELMNKENLTDDEYELFKTFYHMEEEATSERYERCRERGEDRGE